MRWWKNPSLFFLKMAGTAVLVIFSGNWFSGLLTRVLEQWSLPLGIEFGIAAGVLLLALWLAWRLGRKLLHITRLIRLNAPPPCKHLILLVSKDSRTVEWLDDDQLVIEGKMLELSSGKDLVADYERIEQKGIHWNREPILRALEPHLKGGRRLQIHLLGSKPDTDGRPGSVAQLDTLRDKLLSRYLPAGCIYKARESADFTDPDDVLSAIGHIVEGLCPQDEDYEDVVIDVTGGTKTASIAAAMATLKYPQLTFQYVATEGDKRVIAFNAVSTVNDRFTGL